MICNYSKISHVLISVVMVLAKRIPTVYCAACTFLIFYGFPYRKSYWSSASSLPFFIYFLLVFCLFLYGFQCTYSVLTDPRSRLVCTSVDFSCATWILSPVACCLLPVIVNLYLVCRLLSCALRLRLKLLACSLVS